MASPCCRTDPRLAGLIAAACLLAAASARAAEPAPTVIVDDMPTLAAITASAGGHTAYCLDGGSGAVVGVDPRAPHTRRRVLAGAAVEPRPLGIACIDSSTLVAVCVAGDAWSLRTWRIRPDEELAQGAAVQAIPLGTAADPAASAPRLVVARSREWLAIVGLPAPLPAVLRAPIAGARLGAPSDRGCPQLAASARPVAAAASPADELVIVTAACPGAGDAGQGGGGDVVSYYSTTGRTLLTLDSGLRGVRGVAFDREDGSLWAVAGDATPGLWRLDARFVAGRQAIRGQRLAPLASATGIVSLSGRMVAVLLGPPDQRLVRLDLDAPEVPVP